MGFLSRTMYEDFVMPGFDGVLECARGILDEYEERTGRRVYGLAGVG